ncbi:MAG TPA: ATP-binding protein [Solirubrobacteraceae bacterium]|nr:ATP-binding protein [Solirubrobacteraceae bacterium]
MGVSIEAELPRDPAAARLARRLLEELAADRLEANELDRSKLLVSELVNNAVLHGQGNITLRVDLDEDRLRAEVIDEGSGFERVVRDDTFDLLGGWGLALVEAESSRWGVHEGTAHVWFEIEQPGPRMARTRTSTQPIATEQQPAAARVQSRAARPSVMLFAGRVTWLEQPQDEIALRLDRRERLVDVEADLVNSSVALRRRASRFVMFAWSYWASGRHDTGQVPARLAHE